MDQQFAEREKELIKLNSKVNAKTKKIQSNTIAKIQVQTANNNFNFYDESESVGFEVKCKKINLGNLPTKKQHEVSYPQHLSRKLRTNLDIHLPTSSLLPDGYADPELEEKSVIDSEIIQESLKAESLKTRYSNDSSVIPPVPPIESLPRVAEEIVSEVIPKTLERKNVSNEGLLKFLKSKVALLQTELEAGKNLNDTLEKENSKLQKKLKKFTLQEEKFKSRIESLENSLKSLEEKKEINEQHLRDKESTIHELNREQVKLRDELKASNHHEQVLEKQTLKLQEDLEYLTSKYETLRDAEMVIRDSSREERLAYEEKMKNLRKSRMDLLKAYKQQIILIDNLKRQNICLEKAKVLEIAEKEFLKVLDWNFIEK